ncbi:ribonuclease III [Candidatus Woesebacteria bacterium RIFCSPHIGHO2_01_FULL_39_32]|uniref:Ribonuclease 3 n=2 Tax=Candidatus Woeseibacteriota TaxID=1752722 RepID=A0A0G0PS18_9BACT|nr:MAG: Ribonuclease 3 [Candidatus Woesebacteria bacterium GW2011_GWA1_39_8]OGM05188.1 MAG: ribonuclease III [Candidatus Woesebacteria bacterium GWB1_37_5]OGM23857.1 MAG: ribonuclease III [Candidatus Woesebacteria bacterium RIFCSPHIGHO2_01_FULL_39_32]OGM38349.1 MAG: ribonuclease III [Candidatus Woesebacteria bacterium RIFCSPHIGHO2_12_FULL_38_11]OGM64046.1 MAG: ribonuclease III [Candidatus Woesebacteria bacterium RIFCSPLOWO2_01_FULL_39_25]
MSKNDLASLFKNLFLYEQALTHKSWVNEHPGKRGSNERLEFLGDAVLEFIVSKELYARFPDKEEGYLTALRANLVNTINLSEIAKSLNLGQKLYLSKGEEETGGRTNHSLLANTVEAIVGALFLDSGLGDVEKFIEEHLLSTLDKKLAQPLKDSKSLLQEYVQALGYPAPRYEVVEESGPDHSKQFTIAAMVNGDSLGRGRGRNKSEAAQEAARVALENVMQKQLKE